MRVMGFRAEKDAVHWALVSGTRDQPVILTHDRLRAPDDLSEPDVLRWLRSEIQFLLVQHRPDGIAIRLVECNPATFKTPKGLSFVYRRARVEGILLEATCTRQDEASRRRTVESGDESTGTLLRNLFAYQDGRKVDWQDIKSQSRRQAILIAAKSLPCVANSSLPDEVS